MNNEDTRNNHGNYQLPPEGASWLEGIAKQKEMPQFPKADFKSRPYISNHFLSDVSPQTLSEI
jgi:hypothetical protein